MPVVSPNQLMAARGRGATTTPPTPAPHLTRDPRPPPTASQGGMSSRQALAGPEAQAPPSMLSCCDHQDGAKRATGTAPGPCCSKLYLCTFRWPPQSVRMASAVACTAARPVAALAPAAKAQRVAIRCGLI